MIKFVLAYCGFLPMHLRNPSISSAGIRCRNIIFKWYHTLHFVTVAFGFHSMLFNGTSSVHFKPILIICPSEKVMNLSADEL